MSLFKPDAAPPEKFKDRSYTLELRTMKRLLLWVAIGLLTSALLDPLLYFMLDQPILWSRDMFMAAGGLICFYLYLYIKIRNERRKSDWMRKLRKGKHDDLPEM
jgi:hypothetical protein